MNVEPFRDEFEFELAYNQSYTCVIFLNCLLFSSIVPIIPMFACFYFYVKYLIDKYNLVFVYYKKFDSGGKIRNGVKKFLVYNLVFYLIVINSFFLFRFEYPEFKWLGPLLVIGWILVLCYIFNKVVTTDGVKIKNIM